MLETFKREDRPMFWVGLSIHLPGYVGYLGILLLFEQEQELAMRTLNLQEASIRKIYGDEDFRIDTLITQAEANIFYRYKLIFPFLHIVNAENRWNYRLLGKASYNYY